MTEVPTPEEVFHWVLQEFWGGWRHLEHLFFLREDAAVNEEMNQKGSEQLVPTCEPRH
jgi:hypothetical protein